MFIKTHYGLIMAQISPHMGTSCAYVGFIINFDKYFCHPKLFLARPTNLPKYSYPLLKWLIHLKISYHYNVRYLSNGRRFSKLLIFITPYHYKFITSAQKKKAQSFCLLIFFAWNKNVQDLTRKVTECSRLLVWVELNFKGYQLRNQYRNLEYSSFLEKLLLENVNVSLQTFISYPNHVAW
jgi:hypothetical protein